VGMAHSTSRTVRLLSGPDTRMLGAPQARTPARGKCSIEQLADDEVAA
jgi:hypothetical protein